MSLRKWIFVGLSGVAPATFATASDLFAGTLQQGQTAAVPELGAGGAGAALAFLLGMALLIHEHKKATRRASSPGPS